MYILLHGSHLRAVTDADDDDDVDAGRHSTTTRAPIIITPICLQILKKMAKIGPLHSEIIGGMCQLSLYRPKNYKI